jgi:hypothetical protein
VAVGEWLRRADRSATGPRDDTEPEPARQHEGPTRS